MSNWEPGDLALCTRPGKLVHRGRTGKRCIHGGLGAPPLGSVREVLRVELALTDLGRPFDCGCEVLVLAGGKQGVAMRFVKVTPGADVEETEKLLEGA
jgi:hypothetical protein